MTDRNRTPKCLASRFRLNALAKEILSQSSSILTMAEAIELAKAESKREVISKIGGRIHA